MKPLEIAKNIYWVGAIDWNIRDFHGYSTDEGSSYNAYLILDEKTILIDTVKAPFVDEMLERVGQIVDPKKIDYVISNHTEMDHSGGLPRVLHRIGEGKPLYCSQMGFKNLARHFPQSFNYQVLPDGGELKIGRRTLAFMETRLLHYLRERRPDPVSSDAFGQHYAGLERFDDQVGETII